MGTNQEMMRSVLHYIEEHLDGELTLDMTAAFADCSPYHVHKLFTVIYGMPLRAYIRHRQASRGALLLIQGDLRIAGIASVCGYPSQWAFHKAFLRLYRTTPGTLRKRKSVYVLQESLQLHQQPDISHMYMDMEVQYWIETQLEGYGADTRHGFHVIGKCHCRRNRYLKAHPQKDSIVYGIHNYTGTNMDAGQPCFQCLAGIAVEQVHRQKLTHRILPAGVYLVFSFYADPKTSVGPLAQDIYRNWLLKSAYRLHSDYCMDIVKYGKENEQGIARIEYCIPVLR